MGYEAGELSRYGVPGMKWGVKRANKNAAKTDKHSSLAKNAKNHASINTDVVREKYKKKADEALDKISNQKVSSAINKFNQAGKAHDAKTAARDKARQEKVSSAIKYKKNKRG